jgi:hypothetical protein
MYVCFCSLSIETSSWECQWRHHLTSLQWVLVMGVHTKQITTENTDESMTWQCLSLQQVKKKWKYPHNRPWRPTGLWDVEDPTSFRQSVHRRLWGCQPYALAVLCFPEILFFCFWYSFLLEAEWTPGPRAAGRIRYIENPFTSSGLEPAIFWLVA